MTEQSTLYLFMHLVKVLQNYLDNNFFSVFVLFVSCDSVGNIRSF